MSYKRYELTQIVIDDQGYDESGHYWGRPSNVYQLSDTESFDFDKFFRAASIPAALRLACEAHDADINDILVIIPGATDDDFTI